MVTDAGYEPPEGVAAAATTHAVVRRSSQASSVLLVLVPVTKNFKLKCDGKTIVSIELETVGKLGVITLFPVLYMILHTLMIHLPTYLSSFPPELCERLRGYK